MSRTEGLLGEWGQLRLLAAERPILIVELMVEFSALSRVPMVTQGAKSMCALFDRQTLMDRYAPRWDDASSHAVLREAIGDELKKKGYSLRLDCSLQDWEQGLGAIRWSKSVAVRDAREFRADPCGHLGVPSDLKGVGAALLGPWEAVVRATAYLDVEDFNAVMDRLGDAGMLPTALAAMQADAISRDIVDLGSKSKPMSL